MEASERLTAAPDHALGQYRAWRLDRPDGRPPQNAPAPLDLAWISIAHAPRPASHRLLPHGEPSIAIMRRRDASGAVIEARLTVCGPYYKARHYRPQPREELIGFRVKPEFSAALFKIAPNDYAGAPIAQAPAALVQACAAALCMAEYAGANDVFTALAADLAHFVCTHPIARGPEALAAEWMRISDGKIRLRDIAKKLDVSERNLRRRFIDHVGCAPKTYARQLQVTAAALAAEKEEAPDWAAIAADAGFHDQSHMINVFQAEIGLSPLAFHIERRALKA